PITSTQLILSTPPRRSSDLDTAFRTFAAGFVRDKGVPEAMASRLTGVPKVALLEPTRGVQFTPVGPDLDTLSVRSREEVMMWAGMASERTVDLEPYVYGQEWVRDLFPETLLKEYVFTATPVPRNGEDCYHL